MNLHRAIFILFTVFILLQHYQSKELPKMSEQIGQQIFHKNKIYLLYVVDDENIHTQTYKMFEKFYNQVEHPCAILNEFSENYLAFKMFIGFNKEEFFTIIDASRRLKYILPILQGMTVNDLISFQTKFEQGLLEPYYSSEQPENEPYKPCRKLVGKDLSDFLETETPVKVLYLYTVHPTCQICSEMLHLYSQLAENLYDEKVVSFGYFDVFANDHPLINDQIVPYFLIFDNSEDQPVGVPGENMQDLYDAILQIVMKDVPLTNKEEQQPKRDTQRAEQVMLEDIIFEEDQMELDEDL